MNVALIKRMNRANLRTPFALEWQESITKEDKEFLDAYAERHPIRMREMTHELRLWGFEGHGSDAKLPKIMKLVEDERIKRADAPEKKDTKKR